MLVGNAKKVRFKRKRRYRSVEGKTNKQGIRFKDECLVWGKLQIPVLIDKNDPVILHSLNSPIKFCRIVRKSIKGRQRWYIQLVCEGSAYVKPKNKIGEGVVGVDLNVSAAGIVSDQGASLSEFCSELNRREKEIKKLQRQNSRQLRANNPQNYEPNFKARRGNKAVTKKGKVKKGSKQWNRSKRYLKTQAKKAEIQRRQQEHRKSLHGKLVNEVIRQGNHFKMEKVSVKAWQKNWGKQIGYKSPGEFQSRLVRKAESAGGQVDKFSCQKTKLSQTCVCGRVQKKSLSQRIHECVCGVNVKRDVLSAFLARNVTDDSLIMSSVLSDWGRLETVLRQAFRSSKLQASRRCRKQEMSVFLGATLSRILHESRKSEAVGYTKPSGLKNPRFSKTGSSQQYDLILRAIAPSNSKSTSKKRASSFTAGIPSSMSQYPGKLAIALS